MPAGIQQDVCDRIPDFARCAQDASVKALGEDRAAATVRPVQRARDTGAERHHAARERRRVGRFDEEVRVRGLQRVVHEAEVTAVAGRREAALERANERDGAQGREAGQKLNGHVCWKAGNDALAPTMPDASVGPALASGTGSGAAPAPAFLQMETKLRGRSVHRRLE
jgi:hypothetical protein